MEQNAISKSLDTEKGLKWRDSISYSHHPYKKCTKTIGRCLQLAIKELTLGCNGLGFQNLRGVRDQGRAVRRLRSQMGPDHDQNCLPDIFCEMDMDDMFWEMPTREIFKSLKWAMKELGQQKRAVWFSITKGGLKQRDRVRRASARDFWIVSSEEVKRSVCNVMEPLHPR